MFHHDGQHKVSTASSLLHRALNLPNSSEGKKRKLNYIHAALESNGSSIEVHKKHTGQQQQMHPLGNLLEYFSRWLNQPSHASLSLLFLTSKEPLTRVLKKYHVTVVNEPFTTLQQQFPAPKFRPSMESQTNFVYKIPCKNCSWCYIGETGRAFTVTPEKKNIWETPKLRPKVIELLITPGPTTTPLILKTRQLLRVTPNADNNSCPLARQYNILFNKHL